MLQQQDFFNDDHYYDIDSVQLRKYFEDQKLIWNYLQSFIQPDKLKQISTLDQLKGEFGMEEIVQPEQEDAEEPKIEKKLIQVIVPVGLPGMGKSTLGERLLESEIFSEGTHFVSISNDQIRRSLVHQYFQENPDADQQEAFQATAKGLQSEIERQIVYSIEMMSDLDHLVLFMDKNHPPKILKT